MAMQNRSKSEQTLQYIASGTDTKEMSRGGLIFFYACRLRGQLTCTNANNTRALLRRADALAVINRMRVRINSQENVFDLDGPGIVADNWYLLGDVPHDNLGQLGDATTANPAFDVSFVIAFEIPRRKVAVPFDTALDARVGRMSKLELEVQWNDHTAINANATGFTIAPVLEVESYKGFGAPDDKTPGYLRRYKLQQTFTATNPRELVRLATTYAYHGFLLNTTNQNGAGAEVDFSGEGGTTQMLNRAKLVSGSTVFEDRGPEILNDAFGRLWMGRARTWISGFVPTPVGTATVNGFAAAAGFGGGFSLPQNGSNFDLRAWFPIEMPYDGNLREMLDAAQLAEFQLELDLTVAANTSRINVYPYQYVVPPGRAAA